MEKLLNRVRALWPRLWLDDDKEYETMQLSRRDKRSLWYGAFVVCALTIILTSIVISIKTEKANVQAEKDLYSLLDTITVYIASATDDEYAEIAEQIRHDLILSKYNQNIENYIQHIPNTADNCCAEQENDSELVYLLCTNTGELYPLDNFEAEKDPESGEYTDRSIYFAYDEVSETNAKITLFPEKKQTSVSFSQGEGIVSIHRVKRLFCDSCIEKILVAVDKNLMPEYVLFDPVKTMFYPVAEGTQTINNTALAISYGSEGTAIINLRWLNV